MGVFSINAITDRGKNLLADVQAGAVFIPTRIVMGSGNIPVGSSAASMTAVVAPVIELEVSKIKKTADGKVIIGGVYTNESITQEFYFRELALYAKAEYRDGNGNVVQTVSECLYTYGNSANTADLMPAYLSGTVVERNIDLVTWVGNNTQIELTIESGVGVTRDEFEAEQERIDLLATNNNIKSYITLAQLGLANSDMSSTDLQANMVKLVNAMPEASRLLRSGSTDNDNLTKSIVAKLKADIGIRDDNYSVTLDFTVSANKKNAIELTVNVSNSTPYVFDTYSCTFYDKTTLSKFSKNHATEYYWNLNPENSGFNTLLGYMATRYNEHPVIFAYISGFSDLPSASTAGQGIINLAGGILSVTLFTLDGVLYRRTNSLAEWTGDWTYSCELKNGNIEVNGTIGTKNVVTNRIARMFSHNNAAYEIDLVNYIDSNNYQGIRVKTEASDLSNALNLVRMVNGKFSSYPIYHAGNKPTAADVGAAPAYTYGTTDIQAGSASPYADGTIHFVYE